MCLYCNNVNLYDIYGYVGLNELLKIVIKKLESSVNERFMNKNNSYSNIRINKICIRYQI